MTNVIAHTNARLENWYFNAKKDFGVIGSGLAKFNSNNEVEIRYEEILSDPRYTPPYIGNCRISLDGFSIETN